MSSITVFAPAKLNLFLAITDLRADGFHNLVSVVTPLAWGDELVIERRDQPTYSLTCDTPSVPLDDSNLVLKAARLFGRKTEVACGAHFHLIKRIPMGAGLGGGSSDAAAALLGLNRLASKPLTETALIDLAAQIGSDCPLFLQAGACVIRGRGELIAPLPDSAGSRLTKRPILIFKPAFGISTPWAYRQIAAASPPSYLPATEAEQRLSRWLDDEKMPIEELLFNNMERPAFEKYLALPTLLNELGDRFGLRARMSGSGSACFAFLKMSEDASAIGGFIREAWGRETFVLETQTA